MQSRYSVIVFDLGNTIIRFDHNISARKIADLCRLDAANIYNAFFDSSLTQAFEKGAISPQEFYEKASALLGIRLPFRDFVDIWNDIFWEDEASCSLVRELKGKGSYRLFLLSNLNCLHFEHIRRKFDIIKMFDELILSFKVGAIKPEVAIFEDVVARAGGDKNCLLYIDDRKDLISAALSLGIDSIRFEGADRLRKFMQEKGII